MIYHINKRENHGKWEKLPERFFTIEDAQVFMHKLWRDAKERGVYAEIHIDTEIDPEDHSLDYLFEKEEQQ